MYIETRDWTRTPHNVVCEDCYGYSLTKLLNNGIYKANLVDLPSSDDAPGIYLNHKPGEITNMLLKDAWQYAIHRYVIQSDWSVSNIRDYMKILCINEKTVNTFISSCRDYMHYEEYITNQNNDIDYYNQDTIEHGITNKIKQLPSYPPMWDLCPIDLAFETPMHLQMNFIHYNASFMFQWAKSISKASHIVKESSNYMEKVRNIHVDRFKVILFWTDKFGGYVAENWRSFGNLSPWTYQILDHKSMNIFENVDLPDPLVVKFNLWNVKQLRSWLLLRNPNLERGLPKKEMIHLANQWLDNNPSADEKMYQPTPKLAGNKVRELHNICKNYCNTLMMENNMSIFAQNISTAYAMMYLCCLEHSYKIVHNCIEFKQWSTTYTLLGILRAPTHFNHYISIRPFYEGGDMGEGIIKTLRPLSPTGIRDGWTNNLLQNYYQRDILKQMIDIITPTSTTTVIPRNVDGCLNHKNFVRYGSKALINHNINNQLVLSMLYYKDISSNSTIIGMMVAQFNTWFLCLVEIDQSETLLDDPYGYTYYRIQLTSKEYVISDRASRTNIDHNISLWKTGIGLPCYWKDSSTQYYTMLTDDGYNLNDNLSWSLIT